MRGRRVDLLQSEITLNEDIPCAACGYNLRGLHLPGNCPECGTNLDYSVQEFDAARRLARPVDRMWARRILEGTVLSLISFGLVVAVEMAPWGMDWKLLMIWACSWVLASYGVLKLSRREPLVHLDRPPTLIWFLRGCTIAHATIPFIGDMFTEMPAVLGTVAGIGTLLATPVASSLLYGRVRQLAGRLNSAVLSVQATVLAFVMPFIVVTAFVPSRRRVYDPVEAMQELPLLQYGAPEFVQDWLSRSLRGRLDAIQTVMMVFVLVAVAVFVQLAVLVIRAPKINSEASAERSPTSSSP